MLFSRDGSALRASASESPAIMAAEVIAAAHGDYRQARLAAYEAKLEARFGARSDEVGAKQWIPRSLRAPLARALMRREWFNRKVVLDEWFLHASQPALRARV